jgi:hypothetical protein
MDNNTSQLSARNKMFLKSRQIGQKNVISRNEKA